MNRKSSWMAQLKARICDERGLSLLELLAVLTVLGIVGSVMTSTLVTGQKIFTKQTAETQFREDADYVTTRIMNEFYSTPFDEVDNTCIVKGKEIPCIKIVDNTEVILTEINDTQNGASTIYDPGQQAKDIAAITMIYIENKKVFIHKSIDSSNEILDVPSHFSDTSSLEVVCTSSEEMPCEKGTILLDFTLESERTNEKMQLESRFGF